MQPIVLSESINTTANLHHNPNGPSQKMNETLVEVIHHQRVDKIQRAEGLTFTSEDIRKFITSPAAPPLDEENNMLRLDMFKEDKAPVSIWKAAKNDDVASVQRAIELDEASGHGVLVNTRDPETEATLLYTVVEHVRHEPERLLQLLLEHGAEPDAPSVYGVCALHALPIHCATNPLPAIDLLLVHKANINCGDGDGWTPLHYAARFLPDPDPVVRHLVSHGAHVDATDITGKTPLLALLANGDHVSTFSWLIHTARADVATKCEFLLPRPTSGTVFLQAAKYARLGCMKELVRSTVAMSQLRKAVSRHELTLATMLLRKRLETKKQSGVDELLELVEEFRRALAGDSGSTVAYEISMEQDGKKTALPRRKTLLSALGRRGTRNNNAQQQDLESATVTHEEEDKQPSLLKRVVSTMRSSSTRRKNKSLSSAEDGSV